MATHPSGRYQAQAGAFVMNKSQFFKSLTVGTKVRTISIHGYSVPTEHEMHERTVELVNSTGVKFDNDSWLRRDDVKAADVSEVATGNERPGVSVGWAVYQIEEA